MERDIAYKCSFCDVIFMEFESILKHNRYYCHKRQKLPRSSTVTTAMLSKSQSPGRSGTSQGSSFTTHSIEPRAGMSQAKPTSPTTSKNSPQANYSKDTTTLKQEHAHSSAPRAAENSKPETNVVVRLNREPMHSNVLHGAADFKSTASSSQSLPFRDISACIHPTSAAITLQRLQALARDVLTNHPNPPSGATAQHQHVNFRVPEFSADGRLTSGASPIKREHTESDVLNVEDSELLESGSKRRKLSDEEEPV